MSASRRFIARIAALVLLTALAAAVSACESKTAAPLRLPAASDVESVTITEQGQTFETTDSNWIAELIQHAGAVVPTTKRSVQDTPNVAEYIQIDFVLKSGKGHESGRIDTLFVYQEKDEWCMEQPYQGIYLMNDEIIEIIRNVE